MEPEASALPHGWVKVTLGNLSKIERGITFPGSVKSKEPAKNYIACLRTANVQEMVDWNDLIYVPLSYVKNECKLLQENDILISMANSRELVGKVSLVNKLLLASTFGGFISVIRVFEPIDPGFIFWFLRSKPTQDILRRTAVV